MKNSSKSGHCFLIRKSDLESRPVCPDCPAPRRPGPGLKPIPSSRAHVSIHRTYGTRHKLPQTTTTTTTTTTKPSRQSKLTPVHLDQRSQRCPTTPVAKIGASTLCNYDPAMERAAAAQPRVERPPLVVVPNKANKPNEPKQPNKPSEPNEQAKEIKRTEQTKQTKRTQQTNERTNKHAHKQIRKFHPALRSPASMPHHAHHPATILSLRRFHPAQRPPASSSTVLLHLFPRRWFRNRPC